MLAGLRDLRASEDPQDKALISLVEAFTAAARRQPKDALRHARDSARPRRRPRHQPRIPAVGVAARRPRRPRTGRTQPPPASCSPCSTTTSPGTWPPCCGPNATWSAPASPPHDGDQVAARILRRRGQRPARAEHPLPPRPRPARPRRVPHPPWRRRSRRACHRRSPRPSPAGCAASRCWTAPQPLRPQSPGHGPSTRRDCIPCTVRAIRPGGVSDRLSDARHIGAVQRRGVSPCRTSAGMPIRVERRQKAKMITG